MQNEICCDPHLNQNKYLFQTLPKQQENLPLSRCIIGMPFLTDNFSSYGEICC